MWTADNRPRYNRDKLRYPSDLTDAEWAHIEPLIPPGKPGGGKRRVAIREVINGVMYILSTGCQWRALPKDLPPRSTVHDYLGLWNWDGTLDRSHHALYLILPFSVVPNGNIPRFLGLQETYYCVLVLFLHQLCTISYKLFYT